jgi:recombination protein U
MEKFPMLVFKQATSIGIYNGKYFFKKNLRTVDYHGVFNNYYFCFEAKTTCTSLLSIKKFSDYQLIYLQKTIDYGGLSSVIVYFESKKVVFLIDYQDISEYLTQQRRKSFNYQFVEKIGFKLTILKDTIINIDFGLNFLISKKKMIRKIGS